MINTNVISRLRTENKWISEDARISDRFLYNLALSVSSVLIGREVNLRKLLSSDNLLTYVPCVELERVPLSDCCDIDIECTIRRSKERLPMLLEAKTGYIIEGVWNILNNKKLDYITTNSYINIARLADKPKATYYTIRDGYLYVFNEHIEKVNMSAAFAGEARHLNSCLTQTELKALECEYMGDKPFKLPKYLEEDLYTFCKAKLTDMHNFKSDSSDDLKEN
jgi:hypothetical protein